MPLLRHWNSSAGLQLRARPRILCPSCQSVAGRGSLRKSEYGLHLAPSRLDTRGVSADRHQTWGGMRWTQCARKTCGAMRTVKPCGPVPSTLGSSCAERSAQRRWLKSPIHRGERGAAVQPLCRECRIVSALPDYLCALYPFQHTRLRVQPAPGIPCALVFPRDNEP